MKENCGSRIAPEELVSFRVFLQHQGQFLVTNYYVVHRHSVTGCLLGYFWDMAGLVVSEEGWETAGLGFRQAWQQRPWGAYGPPALCVSRAQGGTVGHPELPPVTRIWRGGWGASAFWTRSETGMLFMPWELG